MLRTGWRKVNIVSLYSGARRINVGPDADNFCGCPQPVQVNAATVPRLGHARFQILSASSLMTHPIAGLHPQSPRHFAW